MAWTEFYIQTTGSNLNAGSTNDDAASVTQTNGNWDADTGQFIATAGTPFVAVPVGSYVSIYLDADTVTPFVGKIDSIDLLGQGFTIDGTFSAEIGLRPATAALGVSCKVGGAWASFAPLNGNSNDNLNFSKRVNVKAGTYAHTTNQLTLALLGAAYGPVWWRGYAATPGDLDDVADGAATGPLVTFTTGNLVIDNTAQIVTEMRITSAVDSPAGTVAVDDDFVHLDRCRITNTGTGAAVAVDAQAAKITRCYLEATGSDPVVLWPGDSNLQVMIGCTVRGGGVGIDLDGIYNVVIAFCTFRENSDASISYPDNHEGGICVLNCSFDASGADAITIGDPSDKLVAIVGCVFADSTGFDLLTTSPVPYQFLRMHNTSHSPGSGHEDGFGDYPAQSANTDASNPFTNAAGGDLSLVTGSAAKATGIPGKFEAESYTSYLDRGAVQRAEGGGGGSTVYVYIPVE